MKPAASLSLDADNQWSYMYIHGDDGWETHPTYLPTMVPRVLELLDHHGLKITFFVVGQDAALDENVDALRSLREAGHEIGNHSFRHEPWLHRYSDAELDEELARAEAAIASATGVLPDGFRGPGYSLSVSTLEVLVRRGYRYDASTLPTVIGPVARAVYFRSADLTAAQRDERSLLYGRASDGLRPLKPYRFSVGASTMLELPVTTFPGMRIPIHMSYLLMLSVRSEAVARAYFAFALRACRARGVEPSMLLHPLDVLSGDEVPALRFFPGMQIPAAVKVGRVSRFLGMLVDQFAVTPVGEYATLANARTLPTRVAKFTA